MTTAVDDRVTELEGRVQDALRFLEEFMTVAAAREIFSASQLSDLALDLHNKLDPVSRS